VVLRANSNAGPFCGHDQRRSFVGIGDRVAVFAPWLAPADPFKASMLKRLLPIGSPGYFVGTDELGRDMLTRLMYGGRLSLLMGIVPVFLHSLSEPP
jgi:ABC-type dipeptide/oligopeptide/nickel transport system permease subunit